MKTLYIADLDGTVLNENAELSSFTTETLNKLIAQGLNFTIATARTSVTAAQILKDLKLVLPAALMSGALFYDFAKQSISDVEALRHETSARVIEALNRHSVTGFMYTFKDGVLETYYENLENRHLRQFHDERRAKYDKKFTPVDHFSTISGDEIIFFALIDDYSILAPVYEEVKSLPLSAYFYQDNYGEKPWILELYSEKASKYHAALRLKALGYDKLVGFGDNLNDLPLFRACDESYAVENAKDELKNAATGIIGANTSDGVARWLLENGEFLS